MSEPRHGYLQGEHREADLIKTRLREINGSISRRLLTVTSKSLETEDEDEEEERSAAVLEMAAAGRAAQAEHEQRKRLANARSECGPNSLPVANAALLLALILAQRKRFSEAKQLQRCGSPDPPPETEPPELHFLLLCSCRQ